MSVAGTMKRTAISAYDGEKTSLLSRLREKLVVATPAAKARQLGQAEDAECLAKIRAGDRDIYQFLVEKYKDRAFSIAYSVLRSKDDAQDVVQESFVKAYLSLNDFRGDSSFYTWFYRIVFNMAVDYKRKLARLPGSVNLMPAEFDSGDAPEKGEKNFENAPDLENRNPQEEVLRKEKAWRISEVVKQLSDEHRAVIMLREVDGMSYDEIAQVIGISRGTVMSRLHYARKRLQGVLAEFAPDGWENAQDSGQDRGLNDGKVDIVRDNHD